MNNRQKKISMNAVDRMLQVTSKYAVSTVWMCVWEIVDPSPYAPKEYREFAKIVLDNLIGWKATQEILALMEGASLKDKPETVFDNNQGF